MHGGNVKVDCDANGGAIFTLCFPPANSEMRRPIQRCLDQGLPRDEEPRLCVDRHLNGGSVL